MKNDRIPEVLDKLLETFRSGQFPVLARRTIIERLAEDHGTNRPCSNWSFNNYLLMLLSGTDDARTYLQWQSVDRQVRKGAKSFAILGPSVKVVQVTAKDKETGEDRKEKRQIITGFHAIPVFRYEDTTGAEIYHDYTPPVLPPLYEVAEAWGLQVSYAPFRGKNLGSFNPLYNTIKLYTEDWPVFFHELAHASHNRIMKDGLTGGQVASQELIADLSSAVLIEMYAPEHAQHDDCWRYIKHYSDNNPEKALRNIMQLLVEVKAVVQNIIKTANEVLISDAV